MPDSRNNRNRNNHRSEDQSSKRNNQLNTSAPNPDVDESFRKETMENDRLTTAVPDNYERDSE